MGERTQFSGSYKMVKSENFEEFLSAHGASWLMRKAAAKMSPQVEIVHDGDNFHIKTVLPIKTQEDKFTIDTSFAQDTVTGNKMKVTPRWDGEAVVLDAEPEEAGKGKPNSVRREIKDGQLVLTMKIGDVVCTRWFDKV